MKRLGLDDVEAFRAISGVCSVVLGSLLQVDIAVRGAIAFGKYIRSAFSAGVFVAGTPIVEAYDCEKRQDCVGIMVAPSVRQRLPNIDKLISLDVPHTRGDLSEFHNGRIRFAAYVQPAVIPFHAGQTYGGLAVVPTSGEAAAVKIVPALTRSLAKLERLKTIAPTPEAQAKYDASVRWLFPIRNTWAGIVEAGTRTGAL